MTPLLITVVLLFGSPEYFLMALLRLSLITVVSRGSLVKGLTAGAFGLLISTIGVAPTRATPRFTFEVLELYDGPHFVAVLIGLFAVSEISSWQASRAASRAA